MEKQEQLVNSTIKVAIVGPCRSGKTKIANQIALKHSGDINDHEYAPTVGVRILQFTEERVVLQQQNADVAGAAISVPVEVWDVGGSAEYESCWPAVTMDCNAVIVVFDVTSKAQSSEVRVWVENFIRRCQLKEGQIIVFANGELTQQHKPLTVQAIKIPIVNVSSTNQQLPPALNVAKQEFIRLLQTAYPHHPKAELPTAVQ